MDEMRSLLTALAIPAVEFGDDLPGRSGEPSARILDGASSKPTAFALDEPTAGTDFCPSVIPTCSLWTVRTADELVVDINLASVRSLKGGYLDRLRRRRDWDRHGCGIITEKGEF